MRSIHVITLCVQLMHEVSVRLLGRIPRYEIVANPIEN